MKIELSFSQLNATRWTEPYHNERLCVRVFLSLTISLHPEIVQWIKCHAIVWDVQIKGMVEHQSSSAN